MATKILPVVLNFSIKDVATAGINEINKALTGLNDTSLKFNRELKLNEKKFEDLSKLSSKIGTSMLKLGAGLTAAITVPVTAFGVEAIKAGANYEQAMNDLQARTQSSAADMELLSAEARRLGTSTVFGASDASKAMTELGKAGFTTQQIIKSTGSILNLAAAESLDMGAAATLVSDTINQFGLKADDANMVVDQLGKAAGISSIGITDLQNSLKYAAPQAARFGIQLDQVAASIAFLGSKGIKSEMAGTALRSMFNSITSDVEKQNRLMKAGIFGKDLFKDKNTLKSVPEMLGVLKKANLSATELTEIFGKEFSGPISFLIDAGDKLSEMNSDILHSVGFEAEVAEARTKGFNGEMLKLKNSFEELFIAVAYGKNGDGSPLSLLTSMVSGIRDVVTWFGELNPTAQLAIEIFAGLGAALGPVVLGLGGIFLLLPQLQASWFVFLKLLPLLEAGFISLNLSLGPIGLAIAGIGLAIYGVNKYWGDWNGLMTDSVDLLKFVGNGIIGFLNSTGQVNLPEFGSGAGFKPSFGSGSQQFDKMTSGLGGFKPKAILDAPISGFTPQAPAAMPGSFNPNDYGVGNLTQKSEVKINLGGAIPEGTTARIMPNSDAFVSLDMGRVMK